VNLFGVEYQPIAELQIPIFEWKKIYWENA
jgi:hypothetical protein